MKKPLQVPGFKTEDAERAFWAKTDLADHFESKDFQAMPFPNLNPSSRAMLLQFDVPDLVSSERGTKAQSLVDDTEWQEVVSILKTATAY